MKINLKDIKTHKLYAKVTWLNSDLDKPIAKRHFNTAVFQSLSRVLFFATQWTAARQASLSFTISQSLLKLMSIESVVPSNHPILYQPRFLLPSIFPSIRIFSNELALHIRWPKYWSFSFSIIPSKEHSRLISLQSKGLSRVFSNSTVQKHQLFVLRFLYGPTLISTPDYWKSHSFD